MDISVLGPFRATQNGVPLHLTAVKPRKVFALLALQADQVVSVDSLVEEVWGESPPRSVQTTLQTYILQIRHLIAGALAEDPLTAAGLALGAKSVLVTEPGGYRLDSQGGLIDVLEYDALSTAGHRALEHGDWVEASSYLGRALSLWHGKALADVQHGPLLEVEATRLDESKMSVLHRRIEADLRLGRHHELIGELSGLAARHPLHEAVHEQLMLALYRAGRRSDALGVYRQLRGSLNQSLGLDPSPNIEHLHRAVLDSSPQLDLEGTALLSGRTVGGPLLARAN
ncbi:BTAD domain-containing putative transcriptional regulator [Streptomyces sp. NPDC006879]|uniref:AfsR/SARP family transcriptional regulator n=1 Tax=Streptomyces sp. NPDC006879 TaxID=3364767 RepID=UPI00369CAA3D